MPVASIAASFSARLERRAGASRGAKNSRGSGSKVSAALASPRAFAAAHTCASIAWWPRCTPSKLPMAIAVGAGAAAWRRIFNIHRRSHYSCREKSLSRKPMIHNDAK